MSFIFIQYDYAAASCKSTPEYWILHLFHGLVCIHVCIYISQTFFNFVVKLYVCLDLVCSVRFPFRLSNKIVIDIILSTIIMVYVTIYIMFSTILLLWLLLFMLGLFSTILLLWLLFTLCIFSTILLLWLLLLVVLI